MVFDLSAKYRRAVGLAIRARHVLGRNSSSRRTAARNRTDFYEAVWREAASELGATIEEIARDTFQIRLGTQSTFVHRNYTDLDGPATLRVVGNKAVSRQLLADAGLPTVRAKQFSLSDLAAARTFLARHRRCVIKPTSGTGAGQGVTTSVTNEQRLRQAIYVAAGFDNTLTIESQAEGDNIRMLFLDGELLDAVLRNPPHVTGDGQSSIKQLVDFHNEERLATGFGLAQTLLPIDLEMTWSLDEQGLSLDSVPLRGQRVRLKTVINDNAKHENEDVTNIVHHSIAEIGRLATKTFAGRLLGVDLIVKDVTQPIEDGVVLEVNTTPGYYYHYHRSSAANRVAIPILERCLCESGCSRESVVYSAAATSIRF